MTVEKLIKELQKYNPKAKVKTHSKEGDEILFVLQELGKTDTIFLEDKSDADIKSELIARFEILEEENLNELEFYKDLLDTGFTLNDIKKAVPNKYTYIEKFLTKNNLI